MRKDQIKEKKNISTLSSNPHNTESTQPYVTVQVETTNKMSRFKIPEIYFNCPNKLSKKRKSYIIPRKLLPPVFYINKKLFVYNPYLRQDTFDYHRQKTYRKTCLTQSSNV